MGIRFSFPKFLLSVGIAPGISGFAKKSLNCDCIAASDAHSTGINNTTKFNAGKKCGDYGKGIGSQQGNYIYTCNVHS